MSVESWPDIAGRIIRDADGQRHILPVRVYFEDTDTGGIVYYANYLKFAERARTEWLRDLGADHSGLMATEGAMMTVKRCEAEFVARVPADHGSAADLFVVVELSYQDRGGDSGTRPLTGTASIRLNVE